MPETADKVLEQLNADPDKQLTEAQYRQLRGKYFTVRHHVVQECGHKLDMINEPRMRNCEYCWWAFFSSHGELVQVTDKAFQEQGANFLDKMRGREYRKRFTQYMSTLAKFQKENDERNNSTKNESGEVQGDSITGQDSRQGIRNEDIPAAGVESQQTDSTHSNEPSVS